MLEHIDHRNSVYGRWFKAGSTEYFIANQSEDREVPLPNTPEGRDWWEDQAQEDLDKAINLLAHLYNKGCKWANSLGERLIDLFA